MLTAVLKFIGSRPGFALEAALVVALVLSVAAGTGAWYVQGLRLDAAQAEAGRQKDRADTLATEVVEARAAVATARDINDRAAGTIAELQRAYDTLAAAAAQREAATAARLEAAERAVAARRAADVARRARPDAPSPAEMTAVMAEAVGGIR